MNSRMIRPVTRRLNRPPGFAVVILVWLISATFARSDSNLSGKETAFDLQGFIDHELQSGKARIVVPPGRYRVSPHDQQHLVLRNLKDIQIAADGVEMVCTETTRALTIQHCTNVMVSGLVIDYDPLPFTQGRITQMSGDKKSSVVELFKGYPPAEAARNFKYEIFQPATRTLRCSDRWVAKIEVLDASHLRVFTPGERSDSPQQVGDLVVLGAEFAPHGSAAHAVACEHNVNVRLENIELFAANCFGFLEEDCAGTTYFRCRIDRRSAKTDLIARADPRLRSLDADAFHSSNATKGPAYIECAAKFMGDDCVNIHGAYHLVTAAQGRELRVLAKDNLNIQPGDPVELVSYHGQRQPGAKALSVVRIGSISDEERAFLSHQNMDAGLKTAHRSLTMAYLITLDHATDLPLGSLICAANRVGNGFVVKDCDFGFNRSRGILVKASHGLVCGNHVEASQMSAILISPEYWWLEAGSSDDVKITGNTIRNCGGIPICVEASGGTGDLAPAGAHRNIAITGNTITDCPQPGILVTSTTDLQLENNTLDLQAGSQNVPELLRHAGLKQLQSVVKINCEP